jgi:hypothetical protein
MLEISLKVLSITSYREIQIKAKMRYHLSPARMAMIRIKVSADEDVEKLEPLYTVDGNVNW